MRKVASWIIIGAAIIASPELKLGPTYVMYAQSVRRPDLQVGRSSGAQGVQAPAIERVTFDEAIRRAVERNPTIAEAAQAIIRAEGLLQQARATTRPSVTAGIANTLNNTTVSFSGVEASPRDQVSFFANVGVPILAATQWAATRQARDQIEVAQLSTADVRKQIAVATAQAYLQVVAEQRQVDVNIRAVESAGAHLDFAQRRLAAGAGTRLNELRAAQEVSADEARIENARLGLRRAQEGLGVLLAADGPVDAIDVPVFDLMGVPAATAAPGAAPLPAATTDEAWLNTRSDIRLFTSNVRAAERVLADSPKDYWPTASLSFQPQAIGPAGAFTPSRTWRLIVGGSIQVFDGGERKALKRLREAGLESTKQALTSVQIQARSEARLAEETVRSTERILASVRTSAGQAAEVLRISTTAFEAGATTNLEVIDAQRQARDAESTEEIAQDAVRRARLDLLTALGLFPR